MVSSLRYLGAVAGASLAASIPPARCKEHRSSGMEKLRMQQQRSSPQAEDVTHLLNSPPPAFGLTAAAEWTAKNALTALQIRLRLLKLEKSGQSSGDSSDKAKSRKKVVVAGGGWAAASFVRQLDPKQFEVVWISPHPQFSYTPLLPAVCGGSLPVAACTAKLRDLLSIGGDPTARGEYHQALIDTVDIKNQKVTCRTAGIPGGPASAAGSSWQESYDYLVLAVGSDVNTFNIRGVKEYALFLRTAEDAQRIRARLAACLEAAANPSATEEMRQRLLTFVIVGAGPSGVEAAAEIQDFLNTEGKKLYAHISKYFRVLVLEMGAAPLPMYNQKVQEETKKTFKKSGIELMLKTQVIQVSQGGVSVKRSSPPAAPAAGAASAAPAAAGGAQPSVDFIPTDFVLWASGVRPTALATTIAKELALQSRPQRLLVDPSLRVLGTERLFALGDCCTIAPPLLADHAEALFELAVKDTRSGSAGMFQTPKWRTRVDSNQTECKRQTVCGEDREQRRSSFLVVIRAAGLPCPLPSRGP